MVNKILSNTTNVTLTDTSKSLAGIFVGAVNKGQNLLNNVQNIIAQAQKLHQNNKLANCFKKVVPAAMLIFSAASINSFAQGRYITGDFHQHTTYTDGSHTFSYMMDANNRFGLDWWANSEHGGIFTGYGWASGLDMDPNFVHPPANYPNPDAVGIYAAWGDIPSRSMWGFAHPGATLKGIRPDAFPTGMWRWQSLSEYSFRDLLFWRRQYPNRIIIQALEYNPPGHEHASIGIIGNQFNPTNPDVNATAIFEYLFDAGTVTGSPAVALMDNSNPFPGHTDNKNMVNDHRKVLESAKWLRDNHPNDSWFVIAHPERFRYESGQLNYHGWNIEHMRDINNIAPSVCFGFKSIPGHQGNSPQRGEYHKNRGAHGSYGICTYGGAGWMTARVGGLWDALLSEGRAWWLFASSDFHIHTRQFHPGEYTKNYTFVDQFTPQGIVNGLRSGNGYVVHGDLIDTLQFRIGDAVMGGVAAPHQTSGNGQITINVRLRVPATNNNIYGPNVPVLDHFDIIRGEITGKIAPPTDNPTEPAGYPADGKTGYSDAYKTDSVSTTKVIARFGKTAAAACPAVGACNGVPTVAWTEQAGGFITVSFNDNVPEGKKYYYRLRGTNHPLNTHNQTDACGNPMPDSLNEPNSHAKAFEDLWFYTNPVYAANAYTGIVAPPEEDAVQIYPNPTTDIFYIEGAAISKVSVFNALGELVKVSNISKNYFDIRELPVGVYSIQLETIDSKIINKSIVKK